MIERGLSGWRRTDREKETHRNDSRFLPTEFDECIALWSSEDNSIIRQSSLPFGPIRRLRDVFSRSLSALEKEKTKIRWHMSTIERISTWRSSRKKRLTVTVWNWKTKHRSYVTIGGVLRSTSSLIDQVLLIRTFMRRSIVSRDWMRRLRSLQKLISSCKLDRISVDIDALQIEIGMLFIPKIEDWRWSIKGTHRIQTKKEVKRCHHVYPCLVMP